MDTKDRKKSFEERILEWDEIQKANDTSFDFLANQVIRIHMKLTMAEVKLNSLSQHVDIYAKQIAELTEQVETLEHLND